MSAQDGYREKFRQAIEEQEKMEKQFAFQLAALRKTLVAVGDAAGGLDAELDKAFTILKEKIRGAKGSQVVEQMERVQKAAQTFEQSRFVQNTNTSRQLSRLVDQLALLQLSPALNKSLESFSHSLKQRIQAYQDVPDVLQELIQLHELALNDASNPDKTLWQRLKSGKTLKRVEAQTVAPKAVAAKEDTANTVSELEHESLSLDEMDFSPKEDDELVPQQETVTNVQFNAGNEEDYQAISQRLSRTLESLVNRIEPNDAVKHKMDIVKLRIQRGLDWYAFAVTLEDLRDILFQRYLQNDVDFTNYLKSLNQELKAIGSALGLVSKEEDKHREASEKFSRSVSQQVNKMRSNIASANNVDHLKNAVNEHLLAIQKAVEVFHSDQPKPSNIPSLSDQMKLLVERVHSIEEEAEKNKQLLEQERYKATHDTLTGLPNREAYNDRAYQELQRYQRYGRPLTMAICDIDFFKKINDEYGHQSGDKIIKLIGKLTQKRLREVDFVARFGGEEFVILLPETTTKQALSVLDKLRKVVAKTPFKFKGSPVQITLSFGLADFDKEDTVESVFKRADDALYSAKRNGRNQCVIAPISSSSSPAP